MKSKEKKQERLSRNGKPTTITLLREIQKIDLFNPKNPGPMKIVVDLDDPHYLELKAVELIHQAQEARKTGDYAWYDRHMSKARQCLLLATASTM